MMKKFIKTFTPQDKLVLQKNGFRLISEEGEVAIFINDGKLSFDKSKVNHICYTDILPI